MLSFASGIFTAILPCLAYEGDSRKRKNIQRFRSRNFRSTIEMDVEIPNYRLQSH